MMSLFFFLSYYIVLILFQSISSTMPLISFLIYTHLQNLLNSIHLFLYCKFFFFLINNHNTFGYNVNGSWFIFAGLVGDNKMARISTSFLGIFLLVLLCCYASNMVQAAGYPAYKDPKRPIGARIRDLMKRMTLEEKIGQMVQIERVNATAQIMKQFYIGMLCKWD